MFFLQQFAIFLLDSIDLNGYIQFQLEKNIPFEKYRTVYFHDISS